MPNSQKVPLLHFLTFILSEILYAARDFLFEYLLKHRDKFYYISHFNLPSFQTPTTLVDVSQWVWEWSWVGLFDDYF